MGNPLATPLIGAEVARTSVEQQFALGTQALGADGRQYVYGRAGDAVAAGTCTYTAATGVITDIAGNHTATVAIPNGEYGWVYRTTSPL